MHRVLWSAFLVLVLCNVARAEPTYQLSLAGGAAGGLFSTIGAGIDRAIRAAYPGSVITYQPSGGGGVANVALVSQGRVPMGLAEDLEVRLAWAGKDPYKEAIRNVRVIAWAYTPEARIHVTEFIASEEFARKYGVWSLADLAEKRPPVRIAVNVPSNLEWMVTEALLQQVGVSFKDIETWGGSIVRGASPTQVDLMTDRRIDIYTAGNPLGSSQIQQIQKALPVVMLEIPIAAVETVARELAGEPCTFRQGEYPVVKRDVTTLCHGGMILVNESMEEQAAYDLAKGLVEKLETYRQAHPVLQGMTPALLAKPTPIPLHPGAERYFREVGLR